MARKDEVERVERYLYKYTYQRKDKQSSVYYKARFTSWDGRLFEKRLSGHLPTARELLRQYKLLDDKRQPLVLEAERLAAEALAAEEKKANAMTLAKFAPIFLDLDEMKEKNSADRDEQLIGHIVRCMGDKLLEEISEDDLSDYIKKRRGETLFRNGKWTAIPVKDGTIRSELAALRHLLNVARRKKDTMAKKGVVYDVSTASFDAMPSSQRRQRILKDTERARLLQESPVWLRRLLITAVETALSRGDLLRLRWCDVDEGSGTIIPDGGRLKTQVTQAAPLTEAVRKILADIKQETLSRIKEQRREAGVKEISPVAVPDNSLIFVRADGAPITGNSIVKGLRRACKRAGVSDFRFHDCRHEALTSWARRGIPVAAAMMGSGHSSPAMHQSYIHLQAADVGKAFGTAQTDCVKAVQKQNRRKAKAQG